MALLSVQEKVNLANYLAKGHGRFGHVSPRRPYREEDDSEGTGSAGLNLLEHPKFVEQPPGADSDLTYMISDYPHIDEIAEERRDEATAELKKQLDAKLSHRQTPVATPKPSPL